MEYLIKWRERYHIFFVCVKELLMDMFTNVDEMKEELINETGMSTASISTLMEIPVPENTTQVSLLLFELKVLLIFSS